MKKKYETNIKRCKQTQFTLRVILQRATGKSLLTRSELEKDFSSDKDAKKNVVVSDDAEEKIVGWQSKIFSRVIISSYFGVLKIGLLNRFDVSFSFLEGVFSVYQSGLSA